MTTDPAALAARIEAATAEQQGARCATCQHWSEDDDPDGRGACVILLNDPEARAWRTKSDDICIRWVLACVRARAAKEATNAD